MEELLAPVVVWLKKFAPFLLMGTIGAIVHRLRTDMSIRQFVASVIIAVLVSLSVGVVAQEYTILSDNIIFILCGVSGTFSKLILDEFEEIISDLSLFVRVKMGANKSTPTPPTTPTPPITDQPPYKTDVGDE